MSLAPWRSFLSRALHHNRSLVYSRYLQLATIQADGRPRNRTVVFRGFEDSSNQLKFITDARSEKIEQIGQNPWAEACWYFPNSREQFRLLGRLTCVGDGDFDETRSQARQRTWESLSDAARLQFAWPSPKKERAEPSAFTPAAPDRTQPLENFCLLLLDPVEVDHLQLRGEPQNRMLYRLQDSTDWLIEDVNP